MTKVYIGIVSVLLLCIAGVYGSTKSTNIELTKTNFTAIKGEVNDGSVAQVLKEIAASDPTKVFYLYLDTPGGSVFAGRDLIAYLQTTPRNIHCVAHTAISMGFHILQDGCKVRLVTPSSILMSHQIATGVQGNLEKIKKEVEVMQKLETFFDAQAAARLQISLKEYTEKIQSEYWLIGSEDVLKDKAGDEQVTVTCSLEIEPLKKRITTQTLFGMGEAEVQYCPLL